MAIATKKVDIVIARSACGIFGLLNLFGQFFFSIFQLSATVAGVSGLAVSLLASDKMHNVKSTNILVMILCIFGIFALGAKAYSYYSVPQLPGNSFPYTLTFMFALSFAFIAYNTLQKSRRKTI